ncbi:MAG: FAD-dependent oxidoreductase, partial [Candidatus Helarchaeota archaeon]
MTRKEVAIIGAGITGLHVAIELADSDIKVNLIEKKQYAGGNAGDLYKAFPTDDCFFCLESIKKKKGIRKCFYRAGIAEHENINLILNAEITDIKKLDEKISLDLTLLPKYIDHQACIQCGACEEACPQIIGKEFDSLLVETQKPIFHRIQCLPYSYYIHRDHCKEGCKECEMACPIEGVINLNAKPTSTKLDVDATIVALGYREFKPLDIKNYHYQDYSNVITQLELAKMLDPTGPTKGKLLRLNDHKPAEKILMIQCVGSRDENYFPYCSSTCCTFACKHAKIIKNERIENARVWVVYRDMRTLGFNEKLYRETRQAGVNFVKGQISKVHEEMDGTLSVLLYDLILNRFIELKLDLLVLSCALIPGEYGVKISKKLNLELNEFQFVENQLDLIHSQNDGIFITGSLIKP